MQIGIEKLKEAPVCPTHGLVLVPDKIELSGFIGKKFEVFAVVDVYSCPHVNCKWKVDAENLEKCC